MWFTENPWPPILIAAAVAVLLLFAWAGNRRTPFLLGGLGLLLVCAGIYVAEQQIVTESERVAQRVHALVSAFQRQDSATTLGYISPQAEDIRRLVQDNISRVKLGDDLRVTDVSVEMVGRETRAISKFRASATVSMEIGQAHSGPTRWELTWQREGNDWRVIKVDRLDPVSGKSLSNITGR